MIATYECTELPHTDLIEDCNTKTLSAVQVHIEAFDVSCEDLSSLRNGKSFEFWNDDRENIYE